MGINQSSLKIAESLQKVEIEILCEKISSHLKLQREQKINELATKERELAEKVKTKRISYEDTMIDMGILVNMWKHTKASKMVIEYIQLIKENSMFVADACKTNNFTSIRVLSPYFEGIVWSAKKLNLSNINEFNSFITNHFRPNDVQNIMKLNNVDKKLKDWFDENQSSPADIHKHLIAFLKKHNIADFKLPKGAEPTFEYGPGVKYHLFGPSDPYPPFPPGPENYHPQNQPGPGNYYLQNLGFIPPPQYAVPGMAPPNFAPQNPMPNPFYSHPGFHSNQYFTTGYCQSIEYQKLIWKQIQYNNYVAYKYRVSNESLLASLCSCHPPSRPPS